MYRITVRDLTAARPLRDSELSATAGGLSLLPWPPRRIRCTRMYPWNRCTDGVRTWWVYSGPRGGGVMRGRLG